MIESPAQVRRMPVWLSVLLIALALAGGSYAVYWFFQSSTAAQDIVLDRDPGDSITETGMNHDSWKVKAGNMTLTIAGREKPSFIATFGKFEGLSKQQMSYLNLAKQIANDRAIRQMLKLSNEQTEKLKRIRAGANVELSDPDKAVLASSFKTWLKESDTKDAAAKDKADTRFLNVVEDMSQRIEMATQKAAVERSEMARTLLTPEQMAIYQKM